MGGCRLDFGAGADIFRKDRSLVDISWARTFLGGLQHPKDLGDFEFASVWLRRVFSPQSFPAEQ